MQLAGLLNALELLIVLFLSDTRIVADKGKQSQGGGPTADVPAPAARAHGTGQTTASDDISSQKSEAAPMPKWRQVWNAMQANQVWRPMVFIFVFALAPGNGDAFNSFLLQDPNELPDGEWPGGIVPLHFSDSEFAYVSTIASFANVVGTWIFRRYLRCVQLRVAQTFVLAVALAATSLPLGRISRTVNVHPQNSLQCN